MKHYEIIIMIQANQNTQINDILNMCKKIIVDKNGKIHKLENWGKKQLAYPIKKFKKLHYILLNVEISEKIINKLNYLFKINENIIRNLIIKKNP